MKIVALTSFRKAAEQISRICLGMERPQNTVRINSVLCILFQYFSPGCVKNTLHTHKITNMFTVSTAFLESIYHLDQLLRHRRMLPDPTRTLTLTRTQIPTHPIESRAARADRVGSERPRSSPPPPIVAFGRSGEPRKNPEKQKMCTSRKEPHKKVQSH